MDNLPNWITSLAYAVIAITATVAILLEQRRYHNRLLRQNQEFSQSQEKLSIERRRLTEANVSISPELRLTHAINQPPFVIFQAELENIGDGPIDVWAALVSARMLSNDYRPGIGQRGRDVTWNDYERFFWNDMRSPALFTGISTTKNMIASPNHFLRFVAKEKSTLRRVDAVSAPELLQQSEPLYLMYRVFIVMRGYPLGEILRQVGGTLPDPLTTVPSEQLQFRTLAQPDYPLWQQVQEAISNLTRLAFRLAISEQHPADSDDPLGAIAEPDAWRFFLLHHEDFRGDCCDSENHEHVTMDEFSEDMARRFFEGRLPEDITAHPNYQEARKYCTDHLARMIANWTALQNAVSACRDYPLHGYGAVIKPENRVAPAVEYAKDGYSARIHTDVEYRTRWLRLLTDGYLLSRPLPREEMKNKKDKYDQTDIPPDPRYLEPYVVRTYFFLKTVA